ncbi:MAG: site-2 protease family protein [Acidimicrobiales bacterium]|nr:site-2 protease family protein [Acidimicrobiales bacterium]
MSAKPHFRIAGIPVRIEPVFWLVTVFLAFNLGDARLIIIWVAVVLVSILVHELGHAVALKLYSTPSSIVLHGFGGVTLSRRRLSKAQSIIVSLAGPLAGLGLLGIPAYLLRESDLGFELQLDYFTSGQGFGLWPVLYFAVYVNIWWSIANLLPIRPLDGGNVMSELLGIQRARILSIVVGAGAAVWAYFYADEGLRYAAFFAAFLAFINFAEYRRTKQGAAGPSTFDVEGPAPDPDTPGPGPGQRRSAPRRRGQPTSPPATPTVTELGGGVDPDSAESFAWNLLRRGDAHGARRVLQRASGQVGPFVHPTVELAAGGDLDGLVDAYLANPSGPSNLVPASVAADSGNAVLLARRLVGQGRAGAEAAASVQTHLHYAERFDHAAAVGEVVFAVVDASRAQVAFDTACSWARAGEPDRGLEWVQRAVESGFAAPALLDGEPDLAEVRAHPGWDTVRDQL